MSSALASSPVSAAEIPFFNMHYLCAASGTPDPTMVWGTDVDADRLLSFIKQRNASGDTLLSVAHVLIQAVGRSLALHPRLNCRIVGEKIYPFRKINVRMLSYDKQNSDVDMLSVDDADKASLEEISRHLWAIQCESNSGASKDRNDRQFLRAFPLFCRRKAIKLFWWLDRRYRLPRLGRIDRHLDAAAVVNYLGYPNAPPMCAYKPSRFADESSLLSVTMGRIEQMPVADNGRVAVREMAPMFIRADHRITDAYLLSKFVTTLRGFLSDPDTMGNE